jgi:NAD(P)-dependent dehydrogenase (short-subunit alcohol dehydrogenase family)
VEVRLPDIDIFVAVAGADVLTGEPAKWSFERKLEELLKVDVVATMTLARAIGRWMNTREGGAIVTIGWDQADTGMEGDSGELFAATKAAVMAFSRSLAKSLAPKVRVNCVAPGWIKTAWGAGASEAWQQRAVRESMLGRWGTPEDIAAAVHWLVSPQAAFVTGQTVNVNGGFRRA